MRVTQVKHGEQHQGSTTLQLGAGPRKAKNVNKPQLGHLEAAGVGPKAVLAEFKVSADAVLPPGTPIIARHFVPGQYVDARGTSQGKGFQGVMKRWNFGGQGASHGVSRTHRALGSTGQGTNPARVFKGKKMPGRMGGRNVTVQGLQVYKIDLKRDLVYIKGAVPGTAGTYVRLADSIKAAPPSPVPYPTFHITPEVQAQRDAWASGEFLAPAAAEAARVAGSLPKGYKHEPAFELVMEAPEMDPFSIAANAGGVEV